jgi:hypothetical protein
MSTRRVVHALFAFAVIALFGSPNVYAESEPYQARVIAAGSAVHSGPGEKFYATDSLSAGDTVDVYKERPGGWLAIRPPVNSFSWVAGRDLIVKDGGLAEIVQDNVPSRIGSRLNEQHNASQVRLKKGEAVEVVGEATLNGEKWYKIAPPAGEFRWIQSSLVERLGPIPKTTPEATAVPGIVSTAGSVNASSPPPLLPIGKSADATNPSVSTPATTSGTANATTTSATPAGQPSAIPGTAPTGDLAHDLAAVELRLSRMAAAPPNLWNTDRLERDTAQLMSRAKTQQERDAVKATQEKIARFASIARRTGQTTTAVTQTGQPAITPIAAAPAAAGGSYDAVGILRPVVSRRAGAPQYALVDDRGQVLTFVSTTPDLNLQPYLGRRIGITGNRGYMPEFQRGTVTATRVTPLADQMLR